MKCHEKVFVFAGFMVSLSAMLSVLVSPWFIAFTGFIGLNMIQSQFTGFCPPSWFMRKTGICEPEQA